MRRLVLLALALVVTLPAAARQQLVLNPTLDNSIYDESGSLSNGKGAFLFAGTTKNGPIRRALLAFDLGAVPAGATITGASLTLNMSKSIAGPMNVTLHRVRSAWGEGTSDASANEGTGVTATPGDATWTQRSFGTANWTTAGGDFEPTASAQTSVAGVGKYTWTSPGIIADVQTWVSGSAANAGWIVRGNEATLLTAKRFDSREHTTAASRPTLTVTWSVGVAIEDEPVPLSVSLAQNYPNPFREATSLSFTLSRESRVDLAVFDLLGRAVASLATGRFEAGRHEVVLGAADLPAGLYIARLRIGDRVLTRQMVRFP